MKKLKIEVSDELYERIYEDARAVRILSIEEIAVAMIENAYRWHDEEWARKKKAKEDESKASSQE